MLTRFIIFTFFLLATYTHAKCDQKLSVLRKQWKEVADKFDSEESCLKQEELWWKVMSCFHDLPPMAPHRIGDCWIAQNKLERAKAWYERVLAEFRKDKYAKRRVGYDQYVAEEMRAVDCGFQWLGQDPATVWKEFVQALKTGDPDPAKLHLKPETHVSGIDPNIDMLGTKCPADAFGLPPIFKQNISQLETKTAKGEFFAYQPLSAWRNWAHVDNTHFAIRVCPYYRPYPGGKETRYYVEFGPEYARESFKISDPPNCNKDSFYHERLVMP